MPSITIGACPSNPALPVSGCREVSVIVILSAVVAGPRCRSLVVGRVDDPGCTLSLRASQRGIDLVRAADRDDRQHDPERPGGILQLSPNFGRRTAGVAEYHEARRRRHGLSK